MKTFEDLVLEYDISIKDRRKYNSLMNGLLLDWFYNPKNVQENIFDRIVSRACLIMVRLLNILTLS